MYVCALNCLFGFYYKNKIIFLVLFYLFYVFTSLGWAVACRFVSLSPSGTLGGRECGIRHMVPAPVLSVVGQLAS
jgi:hypothetical protein